MRAMAEMHLSRLAKCLPTVASCGSGDPLIRRLVYDSRQAGPDSAFVALPGIHVDGHDFIAPAIAAGARAVFCEAIPDEPDPRAVYIQVADSRHAMSTLAARLYADPSREIPVIGVTGTDGKSTTTWLIDQILTQQDLESGFISTVLIKRDIRPEKNSFRQSTPEAPEIQGFLREMIDNGKEVAVVEATSHGLSERTSRLRDVQFHVAVLTNINHEHLEFHGSFEQYRSDKANLFRALDRCAKRIGDSDWPIFGVVNANDPNAYYFRNATRQEVLSYGVDNPEADLIATDLESTAEETRCVVHWNREAREVTIPFPGRFNVDNVLAAILAAAHLLDRNPLDLFDVLGRIKPLPGRMQIISREHPFLPIVDYAHTPGAFETVLPMMKDFTRNRLILVFGSAGERDLEKRPMQGSIAARHAQVVILTDEDPRGEDSWTILEEIARGCDQEDPAIRSEGRLILEPDRRTAIRRALDMAEPGDTLLFLGKGHESSIIYADRVEPWDEAAVVREELEKTLAKSLTP